MSLLKILGIDRYTSRLKTWVNSQIDKKHADFIGAAPEQLDTLNELAAALANDPNFATTITAELAKKANKDDVTSGLAKKANKDEVTSELAKKANKDEVTSELAKKANNDEVTSELAKKANTEDIAQPDWDAPAGEKGYIANKPSVATTTQLSQLDQSKQNKLTFCGSALSSTDLAAIVFPPIQKTSSVTLSPYERLVFVRTNGIALDLPKIGQVKPGTEFCFLSSVNGFRLKSGATIVNYLSANMDSGDEVTLSYQTYNKRMFTCISTGSQWIIF